MLAPCELGTVFRIEVRRLRTSCLIHTTSLQRLECCLCVARRARNLAARGPAPKSTKSVKNLPKEDKGITRSGPHLDSHESKTDYRRTLGDQLVMDRAHTDLQNAQRRGPTGGTA